MKKEEIVKKIKEEFGPVIKNWYDKSGRRIYINIDKKDLTHCVKVLFDGLKARFVTASAVDSRNNIEMLYHFTFDQYGLVISLRVLLPRGKPEVESISPIIKGAEWIEREICELFGVNFPNHPGLKRLLLSEDWPEGKYPLRRDYKESD